MTVLSPTMNWSWTAAPVVLNVTVNVPTKPTPGTFAVTVPLKLARHTRGATTKNASPPVTLASGLLPLASAPRARFTFVAATRTTLGCRS